jgi:hypothetical protein
MELSISLEAASCAATQEFLDISWKQKFHYRVHNSPAPAPVLDKLIQSIPLHSTSLMFVSILSTYLRLGLPSFWPSHQNLTFLFLTFVFHALPILIGSLLLYLAKRYKVIIRDIGYYKNYYIAFSTSGYLIPFGTNILLITLF